jgi:hypothetical protein
MRRSSLFAASLLFATSLQSQPAPASLLVMPAGTQISVILTRPVWAKTAAPGELLYTQTLDPVTIGDQLAVPTGTYVQATIEALVRPTAKSNQALLQVQFDQLIFANGYVITLSGSGQPSQFAYVTVSATPENDLILDNAAPLTLTLTNSFTLDATKVAQAVPLSQAPDLISLKPATLCRDTPGDPGTPSTPDIYNPGTPGTPDTIIPGINGAPDTVIPGIPATPASTTPGSPGTPATAPYYCPAPPMVLSSSLVNPLSQPPTPPPPPAPKHHKKKP